MDLPVVFLTLGALFLAGLAADAIGHRSHLPRVTVLLACGLVVGEAGFQLLPPEAAAWYEFLSVAALTMVAFLLGGSLTRKNLARHGRAILAISLGVVLATFVVVSGGLWLAGADPLLAVLMGAIAAATDPAATQDALRQSGVRGAFPDTLSGVVAIDDAWGLILFSLVVVAGTASGGGADLAPLAEAGREIGGAVLIGLAVGLPGAVLTGRLSGGDPLRIEALGLVFLTAGLALWAEVSFLLAGMVAGSVIANLARHHRRAFHQIEHIEWPFMILFFLLAGALFDAASLAGLGLLGAVYVAARIAGRIVGADLGARVAGSPASEGRWYGIAMLPQAGVAVGMALIAAETFPQVAGPVLTLTVASTILFELVGPLATIWAARRAAPSGAVNSPADGLARQVPEAPRNHRNDGHGGSPRPDPGDSPG